MACQKCEVGAASAHAFTAAQRLVNSTFSTTSHESGMFWSEAGAENILALRCINPSRRLEQFWKHRLNALAASNDALPLKAAA